MGMGLVLFGGVFFLAGAGFAFLGFWNMRRGWQSKSWPSTKGKVTRSYVQRTTTHRQKGGSSTSDEVKIEYVYKVDGEKYKGNRYRFGGKSSSVGIGALFGAKTQAEQIVAKYPEGKTVRVYYDPDKPKASTLVTGVAFGQIMFVVMGGIFALVGVGIATAGVMGMAG